MPATQAGGGYRLPRTIGARLSAAVEGLRNAEAVMALATFLGRFHTAPNVLGRSFPVDRAALADHAGHGLTEARVRGALAALELLGFLVREAVKGSAYRPTAAGLRKKPIVFRIAPDFAEMFGRANAAAQRARKAGSTDRRAVTPSPAPRPSVAPVARPAVHRPPLLTEKELPSGSVLIGDQNPAGSENGLEAALARWRAAMAEDAA